MGSKANWQIAIWGDDLLHIFREDIYGKDAHIVIDGEGKPFLQTYEEMEDDERNSEIPEAVQPVLTEIPNLIEFLLQWANDNEGGWA